MSQQSDTNRQLFKYNSSVVEESCVPLNEVKMFDPSFEVNWYNQNGAIGIEELTTIISQNGYDEFLRVLFTEEEQRNKVIDLENSLYLSINVLVHVEDTIEYDMIRIYYQAGLVWTVQEKPGDYFDGIRGFLRENKGIVRRKKADYLLFKLLEAIVDNYWSAYERFSNQIDSLSDMQNMKADPHFVMELENRRNKLVSIRAAVIKLRDTLNQIAKWENEHFEHHYFELLREQSNDLVEEVNGDLQMQESNLNLVFNLQNHRLNEIMKTLTIFSVVFIPLSFIAGLYGMNFVNIPETQQPNGYFIVLGVMLTVAVLIYIYFKRKKWF
jgi:magnesium transporter